MSIHKLFLVTTASLIMGTSLSLANTKQPTYTIDLKSYTSLKTDVGAVATVMDQDISAMDAQMQGMLGPQLFALIDPAKPWHGAVWYEAMDQPPVVAFSLPISDFEAFGVALQSSMLGMMGARSMDMGDAVLLYGSQPGVVVSEEIVEAVSAYGKALNTVPEETIEISMVMTEALRALVLQSITGPKESFMSVLDDSALETTGLPAGSMRSMMEAYFSVYETVIKDLESLKYGMSVEQNDWSMFLDITPMSDSPTSEFLSSQDVQLSDLTSQLDWNADVAMLVGMASLPESWESILGELMKMAMPIYGLEAAAAQEWMDAITLSLPIKGAYSMSFDGGLSYAGFYEIIDSDAAEVYEKWIKLTKDMVGSAQASYSYYSEITVEKAVRSVGGHSVDLVTLTINPESAAMQLPEQREVMEAMFPGGKVAYELCLIDDRIYMASEGALDATIQQVATPAPMQISEATRIAGSMNIISMMRGFGSTMEASGLSLEGIDATGMNILFSAEVSDSLKLYTKIPLKLFEVFSKME